MEEVKKLKAELESKNVHGLALDIDETLADTNVHWFDHLFEFQPLEGLNKKETVEQYKFIEHVPGWGNEEALAYMGELMHSNDFNESIPLIEDANHVVNKISKFIPVVAYITARPSAVKPATVRWLQKHGFPPADLIMRPEEVAVSKEDLLRRNKWKAQILVDLYPQVVGIIDDNLGLAHQLTELEYQGTLYLYGKETNEFEDSKHVVVCPTWQSVLKNIEPGV
jgi:5'(3')-deoxyribonucleotidase